MAETLIPLSKWILYAVSSFLAIVVAFMKYFLKQKDKQLEENAQTIKKVEDRLLVLETEVKHIRDFQSESKADSKEMKSLVQELHVLVKSQLHK